jgi:hypothetical protein
MCFFKACHKLCTITWHRDTLGAVDSVQRDRDTPHQPQAPNRCTQSYTVLQTTCVCALRDLPLCEACLCDSTRTETHLPSQYGACNSLQQELDTHLQPQKHPTQPWTQTRGCQWVQTPNETDMQLTSHGTKHGHHDSSAGQRYEGAIIMMCMKLVAAQGSATGAVVGGPWAGRCRRLQQGRGILGRGG